MALPVLILFGGAIIAWHGSLQHETIHEHPTGVRWIDSAIGFAPLALWPYGIYRRSHLAHHNTTRITDPFDDPESHYLGQVSGLRHIFARLEAPLAGRLIFGPSIRIGGFLATETLRAWRPPAAWARDWLPHLAALIPLLWWLDRVGLSPVTYMLAFVYPGTALSLLRSFAEHRADRDPDRRAAIVERPGLLGLLFLNNNLHAAHHARPDLAWYRLPAHFRRHRAMFAGAPFYHGYGEIGRRFVWRAQDDIVHPDYRQPEAAQ
jgi:fatty acid desaturase